MKIGLRMLSAWLGLGLLLIPIVVLANHRPLPPGGEEDPEFLTAVDLKRQLDKNPGVLSSSEREQFNRMYQRLFQQHVRSFDWVYQISGELLSHKADFDAHQREVNQVNASCSQVSSEAELARCQAWANRVNERGASIDRIGERLNRRIESHNAEMDRLVEQEVIPFNLALRQALAPRQHTWVFRSLDQTATIEVEPDGSFRSRGTEWRVSVPGCRQGSYPLKIIDGQISGTSVQFTLSGEGCDGRSKVTGNGEGRTDAPFPGAARATGTFKGTIEDPLMMRRIDGARSLSGLRAVASDVIQGGNFDRLVAGRSLIEAKRVVKGRLRRPINVTTWNGGRQ